MSGRPPLSFLIPAYNYGHFLEDAVLSITRGNLELDDEIIIINDASTDNTESILKSLAANNLQIRSLSHRHNKRWGTACLNTGIEAARHDLFFTLDADNMLVPGSVGPLVRFMVEKDADVTAFQEIRFIDRDSSEPTHSWFFKEQCTLADALAGHIWPGSSGQYLFTRNSWLTAGRCDEFCALDSWAFGIQLLATGAKMVSMPNSHYLHRWGHASLYTREQKSGSLSLKCLRTILPLVDLLEPESADYLFSKEGRSSWFENLDKKPLRIREGGVGVDGRVSHYSRKRDPFFRRLRYVLANKISP